MLKKSKKELYKEAKRIQKKDCPPIANLSKQQLENYIVRKTGATPKQKVVKPKTIKIKIKKEKIKKEKIKIKIKKKSILTAKTRDTFDIEETKKLTPAFPMPPKKKLEQFLKQEIKRSKDTPIPYFCNAWTEPFMLLYILKINKNDCMVKFAGDKWNRFKYNLKSTKNGITTNPEGRKNIAQAYLKCKKEKKMLIIPITKPSHSNMLIFNYHRDEVELYEPHGSYKDISEGIYKRHEKYRENVKKKLIDKLGLNLKFVSQDKTCPTGFKGFQLYEKHAEKKSIQKNNYTIKDAGGFCCAWSYFYANLRLKFPSLSSRQIQDKVLKIVGKDPEKLRSFIRGQMLFLEKEVEKVSEFKTKNEFFQHYKPLTIAEFNNSETKDLKMRLYLWNEYLEEQFNNFTS